MTTLRPHVVVLADPNDAGTSTAAPTLLKGRLGVTEFVNADTNVTQHWSTQDQELFFSPGFLPRE